MAGFLVKWLGWRKYGRTYVGTYVRLYLVIAMKKFIRKLTKIGTHSYAVTLPKELVKKFSWKERQKLILTFGGRKQELKIKDWSKTKKKK